MFRILVVTSSSGKVEAIRKLVGEVLWGVQHEITNASSDGSGKKKLHEALESKTPFDVVVMSCGGLKDYIIVAGLELLKNKKIRIGESAVFESSILEEVRSKKAFAWREEMRKKFKEVILRAAEKRASQSTLGDADLAIRDTRGYWVKSATSRNLVLFKRQHAQPI